MSGSDGLFPALARRLLAVTSAGALASGLILCLLLGLSTPLPARAQPPSVPPPDLAALETKLGEGPSLAELISYAYRANPRIKAARAEWRAATERYRVDTALDDPEVMLEGMYMVDSSGGGVKPDDWKVTFTQPLPLPGRLTKAGKVAVGEATIARLRLDLTVRDAALSIRESYEELGYLREAARLAKAEQGLIDQARKSGETAAAQGRAATVEVLKAQAQSGQLHYDLLLAEESADNERVRLNALLNRPPEAALGPLPALPIRTLAYPLEEIYRLALAHQEEIKLARASADKARDLVELTRYDTLPRLSLGVSYGDEYRAQQVGVQAGLSLPIWLGKNAGRMEAARAEAEKAGFLLKAQINDSRARIRDLYFRLKNSERLVRLYADDLIPQANRAMQTAETSFSQGQGEFADYLETSAAWYSFHLALARAEADYGQFLARLESQAGRTLTGGEGDQAGGRGETR